ncbi:MAG: GumC family protein [Bythopirellula sp.]|nr:GumC family protein [Bythopirellula sp.]
MTPVRDMPTLGLGDLPRILKRHPKKSLLTFCGLLALSVAVLILLPRSYESESLLFVRVGRESVALDPTVTTGQIIALNESRESELNSILEVLKSRALTERVVDRLGPQAILLPPAEEGVEAPPNPLKQAVSTAIITVAQWLEPTGPISEREKAVQALGKNVAIYAKQKSNIISVSYQARSARQAQQIVSTLVDEYLVEHQKIHATPGSYNFFVDQAEMFSDKVHDAQQQLTDTKNDMGLASLEGKRQLIEDKIKKITTEQLTVQSSASASSARIASLEKLITALPARITAQEVDGMPNVAGDNMRQQLYALEIQEKELLSKYTAEHPLVIAAQQKVRDAKQIMDGQDDSRTYSTTAVNPSVQKLQVELLVEKASADSLEARLANLEKESARAQEELKIVNSNELKLNDLSREVSLADANYRTYAQKLEQARIRQSLDDEHISNLNVSQPATLVEKPVSPKKAIVLLAGFLLSCVGAVSVAILAELNNRVMRTPYEVEEELGIPVVVTLPARARNTILMN